ncbi:uncharacterized protein TRIADDRAFT_57628 [Trichoplax adhaerens]|uniref:G-protein coupled receptors family 1 profile domain-containing protein n=1 Tax=Trichoplax adhaerens TaxID=10228 RepID=B3RZZ6_TRIAD|nr:hypothetical protein TRIADDRAFT_57628 [Trichoplax adhaerens]EDV24303.1 hypothetical protein TRIADDRAFT_57628 [Trichoplax adhaerens]|eukprot:XP_002113829.1 hypothetical protein TRIADDRAFT_57628 [Trichoplax adhaerens]
MDSDLSNLTGYEMYNNYLPSFLSIPITIFLTLIMVMGILGNTCVTIIFKPNRMPITTNETVNNLLLYHLAIADLVNCLLCIPAEIIEFNTYGQVRHYTCQVVMAISMRCNIVKITISTQIFLLFINSGYVGNGSEMPLIIFFKQLEVNLMIAKLAYPVLKALIDYSIPEVAITDK